MGGSRITCGLRLLVVVFLSGCGRLSAFNLDTDNVLVKKAEGGTPGNLFGFSLAMHRQNPDKRWLLVGAPRAKAFGSQRSKVTGGLYTCDMSSSSSFCKRVMFDDGENPSEESKENQWMGVSVASQGPGGKVVVCAHRYQRRNNVNTNSETRNIVGRCQVMGQDFIIHEGQSDENNPFSFCDGRLTGHGRFGSCQQGVAAVYTRDYHYLISGAPGAYSWKGVVRMEHNNDTIFDEGNFDDGPFEVGEQMEQNPDLVDVLDNSYLGFSLDSGKLLTEQGEQIIVAGAPRYGFNGAVMLLKAVEEKKTLSIEFRLEGEEGGLASSFGYDVTVLDLNKDGWQDLVVGAPQFFQKESEIGGAIYIYVNNGGNWDTIKPTRIDGPMDSMFGLAVTNLGDINMDSYHDFAVGAPNDHKGAGLVYIYHGSATGLASTKASQILPGHSGIKMFGYSLAGGMDLDKNNYPDLAVGSLSDQVFVYLSRPVVNIKKSISFEPKEIDLTMKNCGKKFCMDVKACFTFNAFAKSTTPTMNVEYKLEADADRGKQGLKPRLGFQDGSGRLSYNTEGVLSISTDGKENCITKKLIEADDIRDKLRGVPVDVSVKIMDRNRKRRQASGLTPALDPKGSEMTRSMMNFAKEGCGADGECKSNLHLKHRYGQMNEGKFTPFNVAGDKSVILLSDQSDIVLEVELTNEKADDAHEAELIMSIPKSLVYVKYENIEGDVNCIANKDGSQLDCEVGNPFRRNEKKAIHVILGTTRLNTTKIGIDLQLNTTSSQKTHDHVKAVASVAFQLKLSVQGNVQPSQVYFSGKVKGEGAMYTEKDIGQVIRHHFKITNLGKRFEKGVDLVINWPKETKDGKWLLYLTSITTQGVSQSCLPKNEINPLKKELDKTRTRRAAERWGTISRYSDKQKFAALSCDKGAKCVKIMCSLVGMEKIATITLKSRLWNSTYIEDYSGMHRVEVFVTAALKVDSNENKALAENVETQVKLTAFPERRELQQAGGAPWWIILLTILFALLLLALLAFLLWKCGFFERAKHEDEVPSNSPVWIRREERAPSYGNNSWENLEKKAWMTTWHDKEHYS